MRFVHYIFTALIAVDVVAQDLETAVVTTKPAFGETVPDVRDLVLRQGDQEWSFSWESDKFGFRAPVSLDPEKAYTFTIVWSRLQGPEVERIEHEGKVIYERSVCEVHRQKMESQKVPFIFGLDASAAEEPKPGEPPIKTVNEFFPNYRDFAYAGCVVEADVRATVYVCASCREAYLAWKKQHSDQ